MSRTPSIRRMIDEGYVGAADILPDEIMELIERGELELDDVLPGDDDEDKGASDTWFMGTAVPR